MKNNEIKSSVIKINYYNSNFKEVEYINIYKITYDPIFTDIESYFNKIKNMVDKNYQSMNTKLDINDYLNNGESYDQEIIVTMYYEIDISKEYLKYDVDKKVKIIKMMDEL